MRVLVKNYFYAVAHIDSLFHLRLFYYFKIIMTWARDGLIPLGNVLEIHSNVLMSGAKYEACFVNFRLEEMIQLYLVLSVRLIVPTLAS